MSFEAYIAKATKKTGKAPGELKDDMEQAGIFAYDMKASTMVNYLKDKYDLGHGHSMAIWKYFKDSGWVNK